MQVPPEQLEILDGVQYRGLVRSVLGYLESVRFTPSRVARHLGIDPAAVTNWRSERHTPTPANLSRLIDLAVWTHTRDAGELFGFLGSEAMAFAAGEFPEGSFLLPVFARANQGLREAKQDVEEFLEGALTGDEAEHLARRRAEIEASIQSNDE